MSNFIKEYFRRKRILGSAKAQTGHFTNLKNVESVSFAYALHSEADISDVMEISDFLKWKSVKVTAKIIESEKGIFQKLDNLEKLKEERNIITVSSTDLDWLGDMKEGVAEEFFDARSNLFINFNSTDNFTLSRIAQRVNASMVIGMKNEVDIPYNFIVGDKDGAPLQPIEYLNQIFHYLKIIKTDCIEQNNG